ncbi:unnamed protein product [Rotaria magnacalcarata]|uniref:ADP ribosyltransferase domain-containing protein n=1 Tax=Rotaria magnacalcarata TaxID=392030 RepID=A0A817B276_9BILA|nr:unnamed protein product [Rotaria magnacalcarata]CAF2273849.1 unnamed protein product [Rotaria magnacalcarata]CAF3916898.1 unnamed protein product [Rotaria magnacalcarata]CAF4265802.1 unnamed protein product [Rotaria magnacalcarata]
MTEKKSSKLGIANLCQSVKSMVVPTSHSLDLHSGASSNICDVDSTSAISSSSSTLQKPNFEGITLIWYDPRINTTEDTKLTAKDLREINDCVLLYSNQVDCVNYMRSVENEKIFLITSGKVAASIIHEIEGLKQVDSIFIFCLKVKKYQDLLHKHEFIVGTYCECSALIDAIKQSVELLHRQLTAFSFYNEHKEKATRDISKESAEFLWFQLFKDVILQMPRSNRAKQELIDFSRQYYHGNRKEYENITEFQHSYELDKSIYWYTKDSFLYRLVNKALRTEDIGQLHIFRFFISDLSSKLAEIHKKQILGQKNTVMLYRGSKIEIGEVKRLQQNLGCIISANGYLSTSHSKDVAIAFATIPTKRTNIVPVLYEIECNLKTSESVVFGDIKKYSEFAQEEEVLFDLGTTFKIESISENEKLKMLVIKLLVTDAGMKVAQKYIELNRKMNEETTPDILFGILLIQMGKYDQSLIYFRNLLNTSNDKLDIARIHSEMGSAYLCKGELDEAYKRADHAYQMMIIAKSSRIKDSTRPMTIMGHVYLRRELFEESLDLYFEVLYIREKFYGRKHLDTAVALNHIGNVYYKMKKYSESFSFYERSFKIREEQLPHLHLDIAASLNNLGLVLQKDPHLNTHTYRDWKSKGLNKMISTIDALECFQESLSIRKQVLPADHNDIFQSLDNIIPLLYYRRNIDDALKYFAEALTIQKIEFDPSDHDDLLNRLKEKLRLGDGLVSMKAWPIYAFNCEINPNQVKIEYQCGCINEHVPGCSDWEQQVERKRMEQKVEEDLLIFANFIEILRDDGDYTKALNAVKQILTVAPQTTDPYHNHNETLMSRLPYLVWKVYDYNDESKEAFCFYEKLQSILESTMSRWANTDVIQIECLERIGYIHQLNNNYELAIAFFDRSLKIQPKNNSRQYSLPQLLYDVGLIYMTLGNYSLALGSFEATWKLVSKTYQKTDHISRWTLKRTEETKKVLQPAMNS